MTDARSCGKERPPQTRRGDTVEVIHGQRVRDPYRWLEDADGRGVGDWMREQDAYARARLESLPGREALRDRLRELYYFDSVSPPVHRGSRYFYARRDATQEKVAYYFREDREGPEQLLIDPNRLSDDGSVSVRSVIPSDDGRLVAYKISHNAADESTLRIRDVDRGVDLKLDVIEGARYAVPSWTPDSRGFYYTNLPTDPSIPPDQRPGYAEIRFHEIGTNPSDDPIVYPALHDPKSFLGAQLSRDGRYLVVTISRGFDSTDIYFKDLEHDRGFVPLSVGSSARTEVVVHDGTFLLLTNDGAPRFRVMVADPDQPHRERWQELIPQTDATLQSHNVVGGRLVLTYLRNASSVIEVRDLHGALVRTVDLPGLGTASSLLGRPDEDEAYFYFSSFTSVPQIYRTSVKTGKTALWSRVELPVDTSRFEASQVWYPSKDGTSISMFIVAPKETARDGKRPTMLTGYGGFGVSMTPAFSAAVVAWLERGGVWAVPNLRGGGEYGEDWHEAGKRHKKQNVFDDFVAAAHYLIDQGYTSPRRLAIRGGSNGGLLVGAAMTQAPELFGAVICAVPLLDMVRYHRFGSGRTWISEYGSADDPEDFRTLFAYSPYHRVVGERYPPLLMLAADSDDRVDPMHARKFVAAVQHAVSGRSPAWLRIERNAGHGGADLIRQAVEQTVDTYAFLYAQLGLGSDPNATR